MDEQREQASVNLVVEPPPPDPLVHFKKSCTAVKMFIYCWSTVPAVLVAAAVFMGSSGFVFLLAHWLK